MKKECLFSQEIILAKVRELGNRISEDYSGKEPVFIGILNGVIFFFADLLREITIPCKMDFIRAASYGSEMVSSGTVRLTKDVEISVKNQHIILVEDIVDTGLTLNRIVRRLQEKGPASIKICALIDKLERREEEVSLDYCGFKVEEGFLVGYGLDHDEKYRYLRDVYILN
ncbi:MAG: hypoxanthine phosphoribosyltransferase [Pseudomonadota bacterium]